MWQKEFRKHFNPNGLKREPVEIFIQNLLNKQADEMIGEERTDNEQPGDCIWLSGHKAHRQHCIDVKNKYK